MPRTFALHVPVQTIRRAFSRELCRQVLPGPSPTLPPCLVSCNFLRAMPVQRTVILPGMPFCPWFSPARVLLICLCPGASFYSPVLLSNSCTSERAVPISALLLVAGLGTRFACWSVFASRDLPLSIRRHHHHHHHHHHRHRVKQRVCICSFFCCDPKELDRLLAD